VSLLEKLAISLSVDHLVLGVQFDGSCREVIELSQFLAACDKVLFINHIHVEARIIIFLVFIKTFLIHNIYLIRSEYERCVIVVVESVKERR